MNQTWRYTFLAFVYLDVCCLLSLSHCYGQDAAPRHPNILFVLTDDQSSSSLSCYGGTLVKTKHIDQLAIDGMRFTDAYVMPQCTPTRAALLSGEHTARNGMWHVIPWYGTPFARVAEPPFREEMQPEQCKLPRLLRRHGYATGMAGKWHLTTNPEQGYYTYLRSNAADQFGFDVVAPPGEGSQNEGDKWVDHLTDSACDFIKSHRDQPWFFYLAHHTLHGKVSAPDELIQKYRDRDAPEVGLGNATYLAAIEHLDESIGRLLKTISATGQRDRTIVIFLSDNGGVDTRYNHVNEDGSPFDGSTPLTIKLREFESAPLREGKGSMYEGGIRVPCLVKWPGVIEPGSVCRVPIHVVDWLPTLLDAAGVQSNEKNDGVSLLPLFRGDGLDERALFWFLPLYDLRWAATPCAVIRRGNWKLIEFFGDRFDESLSYREGAHLELYDLGRDIGETSNLADERSEVRDALRADLRSWIRSLGHAIPGENPNYADSKALLETRVKPTHVQPYQD
ncbi:MAG: sulfatase [Planctomycetota bacterium]